DLPLHPGSHEPCRMAPAGCPRAVDSGMTYTDDMAASEPIRWYRLADEGATAAEEIDEQDGTHTGPVLTSGATADGDAAMAYDGVDDRSDLPAVSVEDTDPFTVSLWVKRAATQPGSFPKFFDNRNVAQDG